MRNLHIVALVAALALLPVVILGCGSSDREDAEAANGSNVAKAIYIQRGDQICKANYAKRTRLLTRLRAQFSGGKSLPTQARQEEILVDQIMPIFREESQELNDLPLPKEGTEEAEKILAALEQSIEGVEADPTKSLAEGTGVEFREAEQLAHQYGFEWCGRS